MAARQDRAARRIAEREQVSGEIRMPARAAARRPGRIGSSRSAASARAGTTADASSDGTGSAGRSPVSARTRVPERTVSGRMIVLTVVALVVLSFLVPTVRTYVQQRVELGELESEISAAQQEQDELQDQIARWDDPEYIRQQARERVDLVMPGEKRYHVVGDLDAREADGTPPADGEVRHDLPWAEALWDSLVRSAVD
ncbi:septum formation initiator family protein [Nesterenkonia sp. F]|uniref:FtsB family cell division protein n=1 Tax=Nesterenkonia sp. F TaxID=795955 RepID=UPI000255CFC5|nr:septum formation initiator family protein [Nesterenkonia sp. F]